MSAATTVILHKPIIATSTSFSQHPFNLRFETQKIVPIPKFPSSKLLLFSGEFVFWKPVKRSWGSNTMSGSTEISAFRGSVGDEGLRAFEQESFIHNHGSSGLPPSSTATGFESTLNRMSKWLVTALFVAVVLVRHDAKALWAAMGSVVNVGLSNVLKKIINQERPVSTLKSDPGMPSTHAQSIFFAVVFVVMSMIECLGANELSATLGGLTLACGSYLSWLRISQKLHTISQVLVGTLLGSIFSFLWFWSWDAIVLKLFISSLWVRTLIVLGSVGYSLGFLIYVIRYWIMDKKLSS